MSTTSSHLATVRAQFTQQAEVYAQMRQATDTASFRKLAKLGEAQPPHQVLDVACGPGFLTMTFAEQCAKVIGVDATEKFLALAQAEAHRRGLQNLLFLQGDAGQLPFAAAQFDRVLCRAAVHHMPHPERVLAEMRRVTKGDGRLLILDLMASEDASKAALHNRLERLCDPSHVRALSESEFDRLFAAAGLQVIGRQQALLHLTVAEWMTHGGPSADVAREILSLIENSLEGDQTGLNLQRQDGVLSFTPRVVTFVVTRTGP